MLLTGAETSLATPVEDMSHLKAVLPLDIPEAEIHHGTFCLLDFFHTAKKIGQTVKKRVCQHFFTSSKGIVVLPA